MREIKFRALNEECKWIYGMPLTHVEYEEKEFPLMRNCDETGYWGIKKIHPKTLGQYTGLKDENGVEIYEGDIVQYYRNELAVIVFENGGVDIRSLSWMEREPLQSRMGFMKVLGNIHENKELLESESE